MQFYSLLPNQHYHMIIYNLSKIQYAFEVIAYFFKYVFKVTKEDFFAVSYSYKGYLDTSKEILLKINNELDEEGQIYLQKEDYLIAVYGRYWLLSYRLGFFQR